MIIVGFIEFDVTVETWKMNTDQPGEVCACVWVCVLFLAKKTTCENILGLKGTERKPVWLYFSVQV